MDCPISQITTNIKETKSPNISIRTNYSLMRKTKFNPLHPVNLQIRISYFSSSLLTHKAYTKFMIINQNFPMDSNFFSLFISTILTIFRRLLSLFHTLIRFLKSISVQKMISDLFRGPIIDKFIDKMLTLYFHVCNLSPCAVDIDDQTTVHFWTPNHRRFNKPNLVIIHGYGGIALKQFVYQVHELSNSFNLYVPDLLFFGKSFSEKPERTEVFQAECLLEGLKRLGVDRFTVCGISYGGFVAYRMAEMKLQEIEKVVIVSSAIAYTEEQKDRHLKKFGRSVSGILVPESPEDLRLLMSLSMHNHGFLNWVPNFIFKQLVNAMHTTHRNEQVEMVEYLLNQEANQNLPILTQETLIIWGDQDNVFPVELAYQLHRHLGSKSKLAILKDTGHAANIESPHQLNSLIKSFVLGQLQHVRGA